MRRRFWKAYYQIRTWWRYREFYSKYGNGRSSTTIEMAKSPSGAEVVPDGYMSRPMPTPTNVTSDYWRRVVEPRARKR